MREPQTKADLVEQLSRVHHSIIDLMDGLSPARFAQEGEDSWSAAGYLKHLILSVKPFAKAMALPPAQLQSMFGQPDRPSMSYAEVVSTYQRGLAKGIRAEDYPQITPASYRMPDGVTDEKQYLRDTWDDASNRLLKALETWDDAALDTHQLPHPAMGLLTLREMLFFTVYHNSLHGEDMRRAAGVAATEGG
jgi:uncharacterized damage-inducible protein DinB